jgi:hypothetical protein
MSRTIDGIFLKIKEFKRYLNTFSDELTTSPTEVKMRQEIEETLRKLFIELNNFDTSIVRLEMSRRHQMYNFSQPEAGVSKET